MTAAAPIMERMRRIPRGASSRDDAENAMHIVFRALLVSMVCQWMVTV
jgi:hypothetical protein